MSDDTPAPTTYFLKATSEQDLQQRLATMGLWTTPGVDPSDGTPIGGYVVASWGAVDVIGIHYSKVRDSDGNVVMVDDGEGNQVPQMAVQPNTFLANIITSLPLTPEVVAIQDFPNSPSRVFG